MKSIIRKIYYYQKILVYAFRTEINGSEVQAMIPLEIKYALTDDIKSLCNDKDMDLRGYDPKYVASKVKSGAWKCLIAKSCGKVIGYCFFSGIEMSFAGTKVIEFTLPEGTGYFFKIFILPSHRNVSVGKVLMFRGFKGLNALGCTRIFSAVNSTNCVQLHNYDRMGGVCIGSTFFLKISIFNIVHLSKSIRRSMLELKVSVY